MCCFRGTENAQNSALSYTGNKRYFSARSGLGVFCMAVKYTVEMALKWNYAILF